MSLLLVSFFLHHLLLAGFHNTDTYMCSQQQYIMLVEVPVALVTTNYECEFTQKFVGIDNRIMMYM